MEKTLQQSGCQFLMNALVTLLTNTDLERLAEEDSTNPIDISSCNH